MRVSLLHNLVFVFSLVSCTTARFFPRNGVERRIMASLEERALASRAVAAPAVYNFTQKVNHFPNNTYYGPPPINETFTMRYVLNDTFYKPGGPVIALLSGEVGATGGRVNYLRSGVIAHLANATNALMIIIEHRYYGKSFPVSTLTTDDLRWLTTEQTLADIAHFAQTVSFPGYEDQTLTAPKTPWILYGGSLAGAETAWTIKEYGNIIYGGISSSGTVKATVAYPEWYYPIQEYAPRDCVTSIEDIVDKLDYLIASNNTKALTELKTMFGLQTLKDIRDFAVTIAYPLGTPYTYPDYSWQEMNWDPAIQASGGNTFNHFCAAVTSNSSAPNVTAVDSTLAKYTHGQSWKNLGNYAEWIKSEILPACPEGYDLDSIYCFGTHNETYYRTNENDLSGGRSYLYQSCLELGAYTAGAPQGRPSLLSRTVQASYTQRWCNWSFPPGKYSSIPKAAPQTQRVNKYGGFKIQADRLAQVDGGQDPWVYNCVHSLESGVSRKDTILRPYYLIEQGGHHWDENGLFPNATAEPAFIQKIHSYEVKFVKSWLADFKHWKPSK